MGKITLDTAEPTPFLSVFSSPDDVDSLFSHPDLKALNLTTSQRQHLIQLVLNNFDNRKAYEAFTGKAYDRNRASALRKSPRFKMAVSLLQKFAAARMAKLSEWKLEASIQDSRAQIATCDGIIGELKSERKEFRKRLADAKVFLEGAEQRVESLRDQGADTSVVNIELDGRHKALMFVNAVESELREIGAELRRWFKTREFWKDNLDTIAGLRREGGAGAQASASIYVDLSKMSNEEIMKLAQRRMLRDNRSN